MKTLRLAAVMGLLALGACRFGPPEPPPGPGETGPMSQRGLELAPCRGAGGVLALSGAWAFRFETVSAVTGGGQSSQVEAVTRFGIAQLCQDGLEVEGQLLVCTLAQSALLDAGGDCAAMVPGGELLESLPATLIAGALDLDAPGGQLELGPWVESWALEPGAPVPAEPTDDATVDAGGVIDTDDDGRPGVTLISTSESAAEAWAAQRTAATFSLLWDDFRTLRGKTRSETALTILGGPAAPELRGRERVPGEGEALLVRIDGRFGSPNFDADGDGVIRCAEVGSLIGGELPAPRAVGCDR